MKKAFCIIEIIVLTLYLIATLSNIIKNEGTMIWNVIELIAICSLIIFAVREIKEH